MVLITTIPVIKIAADFEKDEAFEYLVQPFSRTIPLELRERLKMLRSILIKGEFIYDYELMVTLMLIKFNKDKNLREFPIGDRMLAVGREVRHPLDFLLYLQKRLDTLIRVLTFENPELNKKPAKPSKKGSVRSKSPVQ
ncbi:hypothetical protein HMI56_006453 [Coelomomyces lativittatus]|nr:hypothetical protein HMI56_006453 [Coelomomyces lativittatus]